MNEKEIKLLFSFTDDIGETATLEKTFNDCNEIGTLPQLLEEFKYFLNALSFSEDMTDRIIYLEKGEKVVDENGEVLVEGQMKFSIYLVIGGIVWFVQSANITEKECFQMHVSYLVLRISINL